ncbi:AraC family transcriptional regulator [Photobacterium kishitanii]|uniref:AraC family transcriptional regulator n=1 Tax=Photobacterium kishitanii TaxID=318456 RepID=UPI0005D464C8|nr:helix-turn-helix transcriptional regulator [Photobacterium kishitanii]KJG07987.1 AraC family transcriptional regulator [Photobacterium kishitanii]OBU32001.1 AraC family transcriptional regulator [Photobacterium kishitanii]PSU85918.1 AraC family transcriptional regulator [Photobacterium kishitanii]PSV07000.1 AraC family transcriptional regulator [Photobacterium kishitanii]PSV77980.1 AraC family transcriptional regulator [Photobacterium kishitanii]
MEYHSFDPHFDSDAFPQKAIAYMLNGIDQESETPMHQHKKCQLVMPLSGFVTCKIADAIWMMPANCAVWVPTDTPHSVRVSPDAQVCNLFIDSAVKGLPEQAAMISISPLLRELITYLCHVDHQQQQQQTTVRLADVLIDQLIVMPTQHFDFPIPTEPRLQKIAEQLLDNPADRSTVGEWATKYAMSERTLSRLVKQEMGLSFARWRSQLHLVLAFKKLSDGMPVQLIADDLGYESVSAFITFFKKKLGTTPKQYLKQM